MHKIAQNSRRDFVNNDFARIVCIDNPFEGRPEENLVAGKGATLSARSDYCLLEVVSRAFSLADTRSQMRESLR